MDSGTPTSMLKVTHGGGAHLGRIKASPNVHLPHELQFDVHVHRVCRRLEGNHRREKGMDGDLGAKQLSIGRRESIRPLRLTSAPVLTHLTAFTMTSLP